jgi:hypothetical protein
VRLLVALLLLGTVGAGIYYVKRRERTREEQADVCWRYFGSPEVLQDRTEECLIFKYGWRQKDASGAALDRWGADHARTDSITRGNFSEPVRVYPIRGDRPSRYTLTADSLGRFYQQRRPTEGDPYSGEVLTVTGVIAAIERDSVDRLKALHLSTSWGTAVRAFLGTKPVITVPALGDSVTLTCVGDIPEDRRPTLRDCAVVDSLQRISDSLQRGAEKSRAAAWRRRMVAESIAAAAESASAAKARWDAAVQAESAATGHR